MLLGMTARMIENRLIDLRFRDAHPIHFHSRPEFVYTLHEGKLVVDDDGPCSRPTAARCCSWGWPRSSELRAAGSTSSSRPTLDDMLAAQPPRGLPSGGHATAPTRRSASSRWRASRRGRRVPGVVRETAPAPLRHLAAVRAAARSGCAPAPAAVRRADLRRSAPAAPISSTARRVHRARHAAAAARRDRRPARRCSRARCMRPARMPTVPSSRSTAPACPRP